MEIVAKINDTLKFDNDFDMFCVALNLEKATIDSFAPNHKERTYRALFEWNKTVHSKDDFVAVLVKMST